MDGYARETTDAMHSRLENKQDSQYAELVKWMKIIDEKVTYTNGKVNRITIALAIAFGLIVGLGIKEINTVLEIFL